MGPTSVNVASCNRSRISEHDSSAACPKRPTSDMHRAIHSDSYRGFAHWVRTAGAPGPSRALPGPPPLFPRRWGPAVDRAILPDRAMPAPCTQAARASTGAARGGCQRPRWHLLDVHRHLSEQPAAVADVGEDRRHDKLQACHTGKRWRAGGCQGHQVEGRRGRSRVAAWRSHRASGGGNAPLPPHGHRLCEDVVVEVRPCRPV